MNWSEFISEIENGLLGKRYSDYELAGVINVKREVIYKIKTGLTSKPQQSTINKLEQGLKIKIDASDPENITCKKTQDKPPADKFDDVMSVFIYPLISTVYAGEPEALYIEHHDENADFVYGKKHHRCFALRVSGKSMETTLRDGDVVLVDMDLVPADGDLVAVKLKNGHQYIKRYKNLNYAFIQLSSDNSDYGIRVIDKNDIEAIYPVVSINLNIRNGDR